MATITATIGSVASPKGVVVPALGAHVRAIRESHKLTQIELAERAGMRNQQVSKLESGENVEVAFYAAIATALKYRSALEMFRAGPDAQLRKFLRCWSVLGDEARRELLAEAQRMIVADEG